MPPLGPVILTESHFLRHGADVRKVITKRLRESCVVFLGVSLTDPNLVGPLWDTANDDAMGDADRKPCFVLHVPDLAAGASGIAESREYALAKYAYLEDALGVSPVFLKSYSQLHQVLTELDLALTEGADAYFADHSYGRRFVSTLQSCYESLGFTDDLDASLSDRQRVSSELFSLVDSTGAVGRILELPRKGKRRLRGLREQHGDHHDSEERFGLFLWLRTKAEGDDEAAPYGLTLVASSAYVHRESWSATRFVEITPSSGFPVAEMLWKNTVVVQNLMEVSPFQLWRGTLCIPIRVMEDVETPEGVYAAPLTVGGIALNTTHHPIPDELPHPRVSKLAVILEDQQWRGELHKALHDPVRDMLMRGQLSLPRAKDLRP
jgi:hypothetical protein